MTRLPPLHALRVFESVARLKSFKAAADELFLTQSAVSHQIKNLEAFFGFALLERRNRLPQLTEAGEALFKTTQTALQLISGTVAQLLDAQRKQIRIKSYPSIAYLWLMPLLRHFYQAHPGIEISLTTVWEEAPSVHWDEYDYVIQYGPLSLEGEGIELLHAEQLAPLCAAELCQDGNGQMTLAQLAAAPLIHPTRDRQDWAAWWRAAQHAPGSGQTEQVFDTDYMAIAAASRGVGVTLSDPVFVRDDLAAGRLVMPYELRLKTGRGYFLVSGAETRQRPQLQPLRDWLFEMMRATEG